MSVILGISIALLLGGCAYNASDNDSLDESIIPDENNQTDGDVDNDEHSDVEQEVIQEDGDAQENEVNDVDKILIRDVDHHEIDNIVLKDFCGNGIVEPQYGEECDYDLNYPFVLTEGCFDDCTMDPKPIRVYESEYLSDYTSSKSFEDLTVTNNGNRIFFSKAQEPFGDVITSAITVNLQTGVSSHVMSSVNDVPWNQMSINQDRDKIIYQMLGSWKTSELRLFDFRTRTMDYFPPIGVVSLCTTPDLSSVGGATADGSFEILRNVKKPDERKFHTFAFEDRSSFENSRQCLSSNSEAVFMNRNHNIVYHMNTEGVVDELWRNNDFSKHIGVPRISDSGRTVFTVSEKSGEALMISDVEGEVVVPEKSTLKHISGNGEHVILSSEERSALLVYDILNESWNEIIFDGACENNSDCKLSAVSTGGNWLYLRTDYEEDGSNHFEIWRSGF